MTAEPGWYPDEHDPALARWWDGTTWTDQTQPRDLVATPADGDLDIQLAPLPPPTATDRIAPPRSRSLARHPVVWAVALIALTALVAGAVIVFTGDDAAASEVSLESVASTGTDPFMDSIATDAIDPDGIEAGGVTEVTTNADAPVAQISGETPGLYGGTGDEAACDPTAMVEFLDTHPGKARAFASAQGIQPDAIGDFVATLTPVVLREDTRVTNHGFSDGAATPFQSVLQAGTAVLVDQTGVPRVRCACGNPLLAPEGSTTDLTFTGDPWTGFDDTRLVAVEPAPQPLDTLTVTNLATGDTEDITTGSTQGEPLDAVIVEIEAPDGFDSTYVGGCEEASAQGVLDGICGDELFRDADEAVYKVGAPSSDFVVFLRVQATGGAWEVTDSYDASCCPEPGEEEPVPDWLQPFFG